LGNATFSVRVSFGGDAGELLFEAGDEGVGSDHDLDALAGAALEGLAVDGALEGDGDAITRLGLGALGLRGIATVRIGDALDRLIDVGVGDFGDGLLDLEGLEVGERDRRHHLDRNRVGQIGFAVEQLLDLGLLGRHGDLRFGRQAEAALGEQLRVGVADGLVDGLGHHRAAIDLLEVRDRHLAGTEAVDATLSLRSTSLAPALASRSDAGTLILNSRFKPSERVSVTCMVSNLLLVRSRRACVGTLSLIDPARGERLNAGGSSDRLPADKHPRGSRSRNPCKR